MEQLKYQDIFLFANGGSPFFQDNSLGAIYPLNSTTDFLIGGATTASAKFAVLNMAGGTPTASLSAGTANNAVYLTGDGILATTNKQTLTLGSASTGNIVLNGFTGNNAVLYGTAGSGVLAAATTGTSGQCFTSNGTPFAPSWQNCPGAGTGGSKWALGATLPVIYPTVAGTPGIKVGIGTTTEGDVVSSFYVSRDQTYGATGKALAIFNQTESQDILTASAGGVTKFVITNNGTASSAAGFTINGAGSIQTTNAQTLTLGGSTTGNINLVPGGGTGSLLINGTAGTTISGTPQCVTTTNGIVTGFGVCQLGTEQWIAEKRNTSSRSSFARLTLGWSYHSICKVRSTQHDRIRYSNSFYLCRNRNNRRSILNCSR